MNFVDEEHLLFAQVGQDGRQFTLDLQPPEITDAVRAYAAPSFTAGRPLIEALDDLSSRIFADFTYRSGSTTVSTLVDEMVAAREVVELVAVRAVERRGHELKRHLRDREQHDDRNRQPWERCAG